MEALRWLFESRGRSLRDHDAGGIRTLRLAQRDIVREIREADPVDAVTGTAIVNHGFPLHEASGRAFGAAAGFRIRTEPARPFLARIFGVAGAHKKFQAGRAS